MSTVLLSHIVTSALNRHGRGKIIGLCLFKVLVTVCGYVNQLARLSALVELFCFSV